MELNKTMLADMVAGRQPGYALIPKYEELGYGYYSGSYGTWAWDKRNLLLLSQEELLEIYTELTQ